MDEALAQHVLAHAPCYVYDRAAIVAQCRALRAALPGAELLYSVKANPFPPVLALVAAEGLGVDAASAAEVLLARRAGVPRDRILYSAPGKTAADIDAAWGHCVLVADSAAELVRIDARAAAAGTVCHVGLRINPAFGIGTDAGSDVNAVPRVQPSKFGVDEDALDTLPRGLAHVVVVGLHVHVRSQVLDARALARYHAHCLALAQRVAARPGVQLRFVDLGSGAGVAYDRAQQRPLDLAALAGAFEEIAERNRRTLRATLFVETGRFVTCAAGTFYTPVVDRKTSGGRTFLVVESGLAGFLRPAVAALLPRVAADPHGPKQGHEPLYTCAHACTLSLVRRNRRSTDKSEEEEEEEETVDVVGSLCTALDVVQEGARLPRAEVGDVVAVSNAGAYGYTLSPLGFSSHKAPAQFLWPCGDGEGDGDA